MTQNVNKPQVERSAMKKQLTKIYLIKDHHHSTSLISGKIPDIIKRLQELAAKVPEEYRDQIENRARKL